MRSGAVTNRTYRVWGKIKLPKYLFKLHTVCGTADDCLNRDYCDLLIYVILEGLWKLSEAGFTGFSGLWNCLNCDLWDLGN